MNETIRSFVCLPLRHDLAVRVGEWILELRRLAPGVKWVSPEQLHVTIKFLGEVPFPMVAIFAQELRSALGKRSLRAPELVLGGAGAFPHLRDPRTLWMGVEGKIDGLRHVVDLVEETAVASGFSREQRGFSPHVTLGRIRPGDPCPVALFEALARCPYAGTPWVADHLALLRSDLRPEGPRYVPMGEFRLSLSC